MWSKSKAQSQVMRKKLFVQIVIAVVILLAGELGLRVWASFFRHSYQRYDRRLGMIGLVPNYDVTVWGQRIHVNSQGFRGDEFDPAKRLGTVRVIAIGDSATFGLAGDRCQYPRILGELLEGDARPHRYEVINAGVEGYDSANALQLLRLKLVEYHPDLVTVYIGWNDLVKRDPMNPNAGEQYEWLAYHAYDIYLVKFWRKVLYHYLRPLVLSVRHEISTQEEAAYERYVPKQFKQNLDAIVETAARHGIRAILLTLPSPLREDLDGGELRKIYFPYYTYNLKQFALAYRRYNDTIRQTAEARKMPLIDLAARLADRPELFVDTAHATCEGHAVIAREIYRGLVEQEVVRPEGGGG
jgi:lysophospholipase L1-like esterase